MNVVLKCMLIAGGTIGVLTVIGLILNIISWTYKKVGDRWGDNGHLVLNGISILLLVFIGCIIASFF